MPIQRTTSHEDLVTKVVNWNSQADFSTTETGSDLSEPWIS